MEALNSAARWIGNIPPIRAVRQARYRRSFHQSADGWPRFYGLFPSREEALAAAPSTRLVGYDHETVVDVSLHRMSRIWTSDYPVVYWLLRILAQGQTLVDLGGHVGTKYRAWSRYLPLPDDFRWVVCDVPAMRDAGRRLNAPNPHLRFTSRRDEIDGSDILLTSGVLQYMEGDLERILGSCTERPRHLLMNKVPTHTSPDVYTLENLVRSTVPYRVFQKERLVEALRSLGYEKLDEWTVLESSVRVPFTPLGEPVHLGFYFQRPD